jgi:hypothetical protein
MSRPFISFHFISRRRPCISFHFISLTFFKKNDSPKTIFYQELAWFTYKVSGVMCSASPCEHCWSIEGSTNSQRRNKLNHKLVEKLVRAHKNLVLRQSSRTLPTSCCTKWAEFSRPLCCRSKNTFCKYNVLKGSQVRNSPHIASIRPSSSPISLSPGILPIVSYAHSVSETSCELNSPDIASIRPSSSPISLSSS